MRLSDVVRIIVRATYDQVLNCVRYDLHCLDPPILTSGMLDHYGFNNYAKKLSFWKTVDIVISKYNGIVLFKGRFGLFKLILSHDIEEVYRVENSNIYLDALDCNYLRCITTPRSHTLRVYLEGTYGERTILRINIVMLLKIAVMENPYFRECLEEFASNPLIVETILRMANCAMSVITRHRSIYELLFDRHTKDVLDVLKHSPLLRKYLSIIKEEQERNIESK